ARFERRLDESRHVRAVATVPLGRRSLKVFVALIAFIAALQNFGFNVTGLIAGLGVGGLAVALAAQKTVENLFGSVSLVADQPVRVGDVCRFGDTVGTVEDIGLRSTRVRTLDRTIVTVPNAQFSTLALENLSRRDRIPVRATVTLPQGTSAERVRAILVALREMAGRQPKVDPASVRSRFVRMGPQALEAGPRPAGAKEAFDFATVGEKAQKLAAEPVREPTGQVPDWLLKISYDEWRDIRFRPDHALWRDKKLPFQIQFFHPGLYYNR